MKNIKIFLTCSLFTSLFLSCSSDDLTGRSNVNAAEGVVVSITPNFTNNATSNEKDETVYTYTLTLNKPQVADIVVYANFKNGTAVPDEDFEYDHSVIIPANQLTATGSIKILDDIAIESTKSFTLTIGSTRTANATVTPVDYTFNIQNHVGTALELSFEFDKQFYGLNGDFMLCDLGYDVDFFLFDPSGNDTGNTDAQTGACIESMSVDSAVLANGEYLIYALVYDDAGINNMVGIDPLYLLKIPFTTNYSRVGALDEAVYKEIENIDTLDHQSGAGAFKYIHTVVINNGTFTLKYEDVVIATAKNKNKIADFFKNYKKNK